MGFKSVVKKVGHITGKVAKYAAPVVGLTGVGLPFAAGLGAIGGALENVTGDDRSLKGALTSAATGGALGAAGAGVNKLAGGGNTLKSIGSALHHGASTDPRDPQQAGGVLDKVVGAGKKGLSVLGGDGGVLGGLKSLGGLALGGLALKDSHDQRASNEAFETGKFDMLKAALGKGEADYDARAPMRDNGQAAMMAAIQQLQAAGPGVAAEHLAALKAGKRKPGEFV